LLRLGLRFSLSWRNNGDRRVAAVIAPQPVSHIIVDRTGMGQRLGIAELVKFIDDLSRLNFELPRQLIDSNLTHV
jgi:hypothetical protein